MSTWLPDDEDIEGNKNTEFWRVYLGFPIIFCFIAVAGIKFIIKYETPKYLIS